MGQWVTANLLGSPIESQFEVSFRLDALDSEGDPIDGWQQNLSGGYEVPALGRSIFIEVKKAILVSQCNTKGTTL